MEGLAGTETEPGKNSQICITLYLNSIAYWRQCQHTEMMERVGILELAILQHIHLIGLTVRNCWNVKYAMNSAYGGLTVNV